MIKKYTHVDLLYQFVYWQNGYYVFVTGVRPSVLANMLYVGTAGADLEGGGGAPDARPPVKNCFADFFYFLFKYVAKLQHLLYKFSFLSRGTSPRMSIYHRGAFELCLWNDAISAILHVICGGRTAPPAGENCVYDMEQYISNYMYFCFNFFVKKNCAIFIIYQLTYDVCCRGCPSQFREFIMLPMKNYVIPSIFKQTCDMWMMGFPCRWGKFYIQKGAYEMVSFTAYFN